MLAIYFIVAAIIVAYSFYYAGQFDPKSRHWFFDDQADVIKCGLMAALFWPIILCLVIVLGPFALFFRMGERKREKINAAKAVDSNQ